MVNPDVLIFSQPFRIMIFCGTVYSLDTAECASVNKHCCPAVFTAAGNCIALEVAFSLVMCQLKLSFEILTHRHKELVMRLNIIFLNSADCNAAGERNSLRDNEIGIEIHNAVLVFFYTIFVIGNKC